MGEYTCRCHPSNKTTVRRPRVHRVRRRLGTTVYVVDARRPAFAEAVGTFVYSIVEGGPRSWFLTSFKMDDYAAKVGDEPCIASITTKSSGISNMEHQEGRWSTGMEKHRFY